MRTVAIVPTFDGWQAAARALLREGIAPGEVRWSETAPGEAPTDVVHGAGAPGAARVPRQFLDLARQVTAFVQELRQAELYKVPGIAETLEWTAALVALDRDALDETVVDETLGVVLKYQDDVEKIRGEAVTTMLGRIRAGV